MEFKSICELNVDEKFKEAVEKLLPVPSGDEYQAMKEDIAQKGIQVPILITKDNLVIDGYHRVKAAGELGIQRVPCEVVGDKNLNEEQLVDRAILLNFARRQLSPEQKRAVIERFRERGFTQKEVEKKTGVPDSTISRVEKKSKNVPNSQVGNMHTPDLRIKIPKSEYENIVQRIEEGQTQKQVADDYKVNRSQISRILKKHKTEKEVEEKLKKVPNLPKGTFNVIYADPPWKYEFSATDSRAIESHYPTMNLEDICNKGKELSVAEDAILFLWATMPKLRESLKVMEAWGFEYKTGMVWVKDKMGMGYYVRGKHELLLIGTRGEPEVPLPKNRPESVIVAPRTDHSSKPEQVYEIIETMYPQGNYLELFACSR